MPSAVSHDRLMRLAIELGQRNAHAPFGAILVDDRTGIVIAEGLNHIDDAPIWHGEMEVIAKAAVNRPEWKHLTLYTTAEPCPMFQTAILWAGIARVIYGTSIPTLQRLGWNQIDIRAQQVIDRSRFAVCEIVPGVLEAECDMLFTKTRD